MKYERGLVFIPRAFALIGAIMLTCLSAWSINVHDTEIANPNRGTEVLDDNCGVCAIDFTGLRWLGSGGQGGRGVIHWPGGSTGNNYGQMCFTSTCEELGNPLYAWCTDLYHPAETHNYGVDYNLLPVTGVSCRKTQLTAMAYLLAWHTPRNTFEDDAMQLAYWKLSSIRNGGVNDGLPHFCFDAGRGYPNFGDTPAYPYVNTVYGTNQPRNDWANNKVIEAIGKNVILPGDVVGDTCYGPIISGDSATVMIKLTLSRGATALSLGNTCVENVCLDVAYWIGDGDPVFGKYYTDSEGCVWLEITQAIETRQGVWVEVCSNAAWPVGIFGCEDSTYTDNQWLVFAMEAQRLCYRFYFEGDKWLSVELASFDAYSTADGVDLQWATASEANADRWEIERCLSGDNGFELIAQVAAHNSPTGATYQFADRMGALGATYDYRLVDVDVNGVRTVHPAVTAQFGRLSNTVLEYSLGDAYPNPFNPTTRISFTIPEAGNVELRIFDISGREVAVLLNSSVNAGEHSVEWNAEGMPSGTYFYSLTAANFTSTKKLLLLK